MWANVDNEDGYEIEFSIKAVNEYFAGICQDIYVEDGSYEWGIYWDTDHIYLPSTFITDSTQSYGIDLTDDFHVIKIVVVGTSIKIYVDGTERISETLDNATSPLNKQITWGKTPYRTTDKGGDCKYDYFRYTLN